jgi:hypothetical protein
MNKPLKQAIRTKIRERMKYDRKELIDFVKTLPEESKVLMI